MRKRKILKSNKIKFSVRLSNEPLLCKICNTEKITPKSSAWKHRVKKKLIIYAK